jgi:hypothetical protein
VWDFEANQFLDSVLNKDHVIITLNGIVCNLQNGTDSATSLTLLQYSGINDADGQELYEGDIVTFKEKHLCVVEFANGCFFLRVLNEDSTLKIVWAHMWIGSESYIKKLGNIFENLNILQEYNQQNG